MGEKGIPEFFGPDQIPGERGGELLERSPDQAQAGAPNPSPPTGAESGPAAGTQRKQSTGDVG